MLTEIIREAHELQSTREFRSDTKMSAAFLVVLMGVGVAKRDVPSHFAMALTQDMRSD
jgi:hypothetical protein